MIDTFIACPTYDGRLDFFTAKALFETPSKSARYILQAGQFSLLNLNCNRLWCEALNLRERFPKLKWFAMLHSDIIPEPYWLDKLIRLAEENNAIMMSAVIPIKDDSGATSTALDNPIDGWMMYRILMDDFRFKDLPKTFDIAAACKALNVQTPQRLLLNTGCMVVRIDQPWAEDIIFKSEERIVKTNAGKAKDIFVAHSDSEDWNFSRQVANHGKTMATLEVKADHIGLQHWKNY